MKSLIALSVACGALLGACQPALGHGVVVLDGSRPAAILGPSSTVNSALAASGIQLGPTDQALLNGSAVKVTDSIGTGNVAIVQVQHALQISINGQPVETTAATVAQAVAEAGRELYAADLFDPEAEAPITAGMAITYTASSELALHADGEQIRLRSGAGAVGEALAEAGLPLIGLDVSQPVEGQPLSAGEAIRLTRVSETLVLDQKTVSFTESYQDSPTLRLGQEQVVQPGVEGVMVTRSRVRYENGREVSRLSEAPVVVRPAQNQIVARGTKIVEQTADVNGVQLHYWLKTQMYATVYSPCELASADSGKCSYGTASGLRAGKGVVAVDPALYSYLNGQRLYIPGYGNAVIGDLGGGYLVESNLGISRYKWIDLGFDDSHMPDMTGWLTVYFLEPAPASVPDALK